MRSSFGKPNRQSKGARFAIAHPVVIAIISGALAAAYGWLVIGDWRPTVFGGIGTFGLVWFLWREGGPGRHREDSLFPPGEA
jgi:hypothetical protein